MSSKPSGNPLGDPPWLVTCLGVAHDLPLLSHWLAAYLAMGVEPDRIVVILNAATPAAPGLEEAREVLRGTGVRPPEMWIAPYTSGTMWERRAEAQRAACGPDDWVLSADVDEIHRWPEPLADCLSRAAALGADCIQGVMIDRLAPGGRLAPVAPSPSLLQQFPLRAEVALAVGGRSASHGRGGTVKVMAARGRVLPGRGGHRPLAGQRVRYLYRFPLGDFTEIEDPAFRAAVPTQVDHVHWTDALPERLERRLATAGVSPAGVSYGRRQLDHVARHGGIGLQEVALYAGDPADAWPEGWPARLAALRRMGRRKAAWGFARGAVRRATGR